MLHPALKLVATQPGLVVDHLCAYGQLAGVELRTGMAAFQRKVMLLAWASVAAILGLIFGGTALLVMAAVPLESMPYPWLLAALPLTFAAASLALWLLARGLATGLDFKDLREQAACDAALLRGPLPS